MQADSLIRLALNARLGDGCFWKHPECVNYKLVFTGTNRDWIAYKGRMFDREPKLARKAGSTREGVFKNSKDLWSVTTLVDPLFTEYKHKSIGECFDEVLKIDFYHWFLDDGSVIERRDSFKGRRMNYRYILYLGSLLSGDASDEGSFFEMVDRVFKDTLAGANHGTISQNGCSKNPCNDRAWQIPVCIGRELAIGAGRLGVEGFERKLRYNP
jgi:hypothetical protein